MKAFHRIENFKSKNTQFHLQKFKFFTNDPGNEDYKRGENNKMRAKSIKGN